MKLCMNIDWLEVFCYESSNLFPLNADFFENKGYRVRRREYGTRVYKEMFTILDEHDNPCIEIRRNPASNAANDSGLFDEKATHIRLSNYYCYSDNPIQVLRDFLNAFDYILVRIFRIDIACDFETFHQGDEPNKFLQRYMKGRYSKINQSNISAHGIDRWDGRTWNSVSWGKQKSMIGTKMYCKTLELEQAHDKPYIKYSWFLAGLVDDPISMLRKNNLEETYKPEIWRVEFSIHASAKKWYLIETSDTRKTKQRPMPHTLDIYDSKDKLLHVFLSLARHYFHFKIFEAGKRKDRCQDKILFDYSQHQAYYKVDRMAAQNEPSPFIRRAINTLQKLSDRIVDNKTQAAIKTLLEALRNMQTTQFAGMQFTPEDILALQLVISQRMSGNNTTDVAKQTKAIKSALSGVFDEIF